jgi:hypothetical protein
MKLLILGALGLIAQAPQATVKIEVPSESGPVQAAEVKLNGQTTRTGSDGGSERLCPGATLG